MANTKMGFEGLLYYGTAGSTAATLLENVKDITLDLSTETGDTTVRGDSSSPPVNTTSVTQLMGNIEFTMIVDSTDTELEALRVALAAGTEVALRGKDYGSGKGPDADFVLSANHPWPLSGEQTITFTATPARGSGRAPQLYV